MLKNVPTLEIIEIIYMDKNKSVLIENSSIFINRIYSFFGYKMFSTNVRRVFFWNCTKFFANIFMRIVILEYDST